MTLRTRLVLGTAGILAAAIVSGLSVAYVVVRGELRGEIDRSLVAFAQPFVRRAAAARAFPSAKAAASRGSVPTLGGARGYFQFVTSSGTTRLAPGETIHLPLGEARAIAKGTHGPSFTDAAVNGVALRIYTVRVRSGVALEIARPLTEVDHALDRIRLLFLLISAAGVGGAAGLGFVVARATLRPVTRLTEDAERIATTRNLRDRTDESHPGELGRLASAFNMTLDALTDSVSAQRQLIADASHELRTPLTAARTNLEVLGRHDELPGATREGILAEAIGELGEMTRLIDELVELARGDAQAFEFSPTRLDLITQDAVASASRRSGTEIQLETSPTIVSGSADALTRAVANLIDNAAKWSPPGAPIAVHVDAGTVSVRDHGPGIAPADLQHVFDRFYRAAEARTLPGSGLGLAIVKQVATAHGGTVTAARADGGGALFVLALPELPVTGDPTARRSFRSPAPTG